MRILDPSKGNIPLEKLGFSRSTFKHWSKACNETTGIVLVTGPTGSGKSTTLAAMIDWINENRTDHIITIEDPIEFVHGNKRCLINQREVGTHTDAKTSLSINWTADRIILQAASFFLAKSK